MKLETKQWMFDPERNRITAIDPGNCRVTIAEKVFGMNDRDWMVNGTLMAMAPRLAELAHLVLSTATIETDKEVLAEAEDITRILRARS